MESSRQRIEVQFTGRVQGVGLRHFTRIQAVGLKLTGRVRNQPDGSVFLIAEGAEESLRELLRILRTGPFAAAIKNLTVSWQQARGEFADFQIA